MTTSLRANSEGRESGSRRLGKFAMVIVRPLPGERRKSSSLVIVERPWRSKYSHATCMGSAKRCIAGECLHATHVADQIPRCSTTARKVAR